MSPVATSQEDVTVNNRLASLAAAVPIFVLPVVLCGCHHQPPVVRPSLTRAAAAAPVPVATPRPHPAAAPAPRPLTEDEVFASTSLDALNAQKPLADAFFDYDSSVLRADARESLAKDAKWLQRWSSTKVTVSGHCDEVNSIGQRNTIRDGRRYGGVLVEDVVE